MPKATAGLPYTIVKGDTLSGIAKQSYGDGRRWREIWAANEGVLKSGNPNLIYPGEIINIPADKIIETVSAEVAGLDPLAAGLPTLSGKDPDDFTIVVDGNEIPAVSGRAIRSVDNAADGWTALINFDPAEVPDVLLPYKYPPAECYLGGKLVVGGYLYSVAPSLKAAQRTLNLEGWSYTVDVIDSTTKAPYEAENITLEKRARDLVEPLGIRVIFEADDQEFKRVVIGNTETIFSHLAKLAAQRGTLITSTPDGALKFINAASGSSIGTIEESTPGATAFDARFDGRKRFNIYKALSQSPGRKDEKKKQTKIQIAKDSMVPKSRTFAFTVNDVDAGGMKNAAEWRRSKQLAEALTISFPVSTWYGPDGKLWTENTIVTVKSETIFVPDGFDFLIRSVEFVFTDKGTTAALGLVPPQVFTGEKIAEPWAPAELQNANLIDRVVGAL